MGIEGLNWNPFSSVEAGLLERQFDEKDKSPGADRFTGSIFKTIGML